VHDETYKVGDVAYVFGTNSTSFEEDDEVCIKCNKNADHAVMLECDKCLRGYHLKCLDPPLKTVPEVRVPKGGTTMRWL
jgi:origin recognition complex subunit 1